MIRILLRLAYEDQQDVRRGYRKVSNPFRNIAEGRKVLFRAPGSSSDLY